MAEQIIGPVRVGSLEIRVGAKAVTIIETERGVTAGVFGSVTIRTPLEAETLSDLLRKVFGARQWQLFAKAELKRAARELGARGGKKGGKARADSLTPKQRSAIARKAARKRWEK